MNNVFEKIVQDLAEENTSKAITAMEKVNISSLDKNQRLEYVELAKKLGFKHPLAGTQFLFNGIYAMFLTGDGEMGQWYEELLSRRGRTSLGTEERALLENRLLCLLLMTDEQSNILLNMATLSNEYNLPAFPAAGVSATGGIPSFLRGVRDVSCLGKYAQASADIIGQHIGAVIENPRGICELFVAEVMYQYGLVDDALTAAYAIKGGERDVELAVLALKAACETASGINADQTFDAAGVLDNTLATVLRLRSAVVKGDKALVKELQKSLEPDLPIRAVNCWIHMASAIGDIAQEDYKQAEKKLLDILQFTEKHSRVLDSIECLINLSVAADKQNRKDESISFIKRAVEKAEQYSYIRIFADYATAAETLLKALKSSLVEENEAYDSGYINKLIAASSQFGEVYSGIYGYSVQKSESKPEKTTEPPTEEKAVEALSISLEDEEKEILKRIDEGKSNKVISKEMSITAAKLADIVSGIIKKLDAKNKADAVEKAKSMGEI